MRWDSVMRVLAALEAESVDYLVIGGVALNFHGVGRATEDLDLFIKPDPENVDRLRAALHRMFDDPSIDEISAADLCGSEARCARSTSRTPPGWSPRST